MFLDQVTISLHAGKGGNGIVSWRREKFIPKGGPFGGDGGCGGSIILETDERLYAFENFRYQRHFVAENGDNGGSANCTGKSGNDLIVKVPPGTVVKDALTKQVLYSFDTRAHKVQFKICQGGKGGLGNTHFKSPTNQAPSIATPGTPGEIKNIELELKIIADVGLVGLPNAGKSTFLASVTNSRVKIAPYPFTTLSPNLGKLANSDKEIFIADIPGIIENAHKNKGLGLSFLRHIERTLLLLFIVDVSPESGGDPIAEFEILKSEIRAYNSSLLEKPHILVLNKIDIAGSQEILDLFKKTYPDVRMFAISAKTKEGIDALLKDIQKKLLKWSSSKSLT